MCRWLQCPMRTGHRHIPKHLRTVYDIWHRPLCSLAYHIPPNRQSLIIFDWMKSWPNPPAAAVDTTMTSTSMMYCTNVREGKCQRMWNRDYSGLAHSWFSYSSLSAGLGHLATAQRGETVRQWAQSQFGYVVLNTPIVFCSSIPVHGAIETWSEHSMSDMVLATMKLIQSTIADIRQWISTHMLFQIQCGSGYDYFSCCLLVYAHSH
jgi:hypothetical protein